MKLGGFASAYLGASLLCSCEMMVSGHVVEQAFVGVGLADVLNGVVVGLYTI